MALFGLGLPVLQSRADEAITNPPVLLVTNVVAESVVKDVIQTLLQVTVASNLAATVNTSSQPASWPSVESTASGRLRSETNWVAVAEQARTNGFTLITNMFAGFVPGSLAETIWAGFQTNGRSTNIWEYSSLPLGWPTIPPVLRWNTNNLMWDLRGMTAISQVCEGMGAFGQGEITALTRRHGYIRGHSMGASGLHPEKVGRRVWFCTRDNRVIERKALFVMTRAREPGSPGDYSIVLFDADLPAGIEPMRVADPEKVRRKYLFGDQNHKPVFMTLQAGRVTAGVPGWTVPFQGGDSGAPIMLPLPGELVFFGGLTTSPPSAAIQADMDMLSRKAGLDPRRYQMQWVNLDSYPDF